MGVSGQHHAPAALYPGETVPGTNRTGGWVGPRAGLDAGARHLTLPNISLATADRSHNQLPN
jgi:hypothetical protein